MNTASTVSKLEPNSDSEYEPVLPAVNVYQIVACPAGSLGSAVAPTEDPVTVPLLGRVTRSTKLSFEGAPEYTRSLMAPCSSIDATSTASPTQSHAHKAKHRVNNTHHFTTAPALLSCLFLHSILHAFSTTVQLAAPVPRIAYATPDVAINVMHASVNDALHPASLRIYTASQAQLAVLGRTNPLTVKTVCWQSTTSCHSSW